MAAIKFNHVTIYGDDIDELVEFYTEIFEMEQVQAPNLGNTIAWLRCGDMQLHLVQRATEAPQYHHFALVVDDFERVYGAAQTQGFLDDALAPEGEAPMFKLPDGAVQLYIRDPAGNLVEVDWPDFSTLKPSVRACVVDRSEIHPQSLAQLQATLFMDPE